MIMMIPQILKAFVYSISEYGFQEKGEGNKH